MTDGPRYIFYANERVGLGHLRRTLTVAARLSALDARTSSLVLTGSSTAPFFSLPHGVDTVKLPTLGRNGNDRRGVRASIAVAAATAFAPHVAVVDKLPLGLDGELEATLAELRQRGCRIVLGLRDIDDSPWRVRRTWGADTRAAIERYYDAILVYGPSSTPDAIDCLGWADLDVPVHHVGYLGAPAEEEGPEDLEPGYVLATVGGGHDGFGVLAAVADAVRSAPLPVPLVMVSGPLMPPRDVERLRELVAGLEVRLYTARSDMGRLIAGARGVVAMAGYNTVGEIMRAHKPALLVPRVRPSEEQLTRARRLAERGAVEMVHPDSLTALGMRAALGRLLTRRAPAIGSEDYAGSERAAEIVARLGAGTAVAGDKRVEGRERDDAGRVVRRLPV